MHCCLSLLLSLRQRPIRSVIVFASVLAAACSSGDFRNGFENIGISENAWQVDADPACKIESSAEQVREGAMALKIRAPEGLRCELVPRIYPSFQDKFFREPFAVYRWYRFSVFVADLGEPRNSDDLGDNTIVAQWHASPDPFIRKESGRGPPLALRIYNGTWGITYGEDAKFRSDATYLANNWHWAGPVETGRWIDWAFRVAWSYKDDGITEIWRESELIMQRSGPNTYNDLRGVYLKLGLYHPTSDQTIFLDRVSIADSQH